MEYRVLKQTVKDVPFYDTFSSEKVSYNFITRYVCQERIHNLKEFGYDRWTTMSYIDGYFEEKEAIFYNEEIAKAFIDNHFGKIKEEVVYEK